MCFIEAVIGPKQRNGFLGYPLKEYLHCPVHWKENYFNRSHLGSALRVSSIKCVEDRVWVCMCVSMAADGARYCALRKIQLSHCPKLNQFDPLSRTEIQEKMENLPCPRKPKKLNLSRLWEGKEPLCKMMWKGHSEAHVFSFICISNSCVSD